MKRLNPYNLSLICVAILLIATIAGAQQPEKSVARLKLEHNRLTATIDDPNMSFEIREFTKQLLVKNEMLLREAIHKSIADLETYAQNNEDILDSSDRRDISEKIEAYRYDLAQIKSTLRLHLPNQLLNNGSSALNQSTGNLPGKQVVLVGDTHMPTANLFRHTSNTVVKTTGSDGLSMPPIKAVSPKLTSARKSTAPLNQYTLTVNFVGNNGGAGTISDDQTRKLICTSGCTRDYQDGTVITLAANPRANSTFSGFGGDCGGATCQLNMNQSHTVTVTFDGTAPAVNAASGNSSDPSWGRVHAYFTSGVVLSKDRDITSTERNNFSKPDIFLDFTIDSNWLPNDKSKKFLGIFDNANTFFSARMTSVPVTNVAPASTGSSSLRRMFGSTPTPTPTPCDSAECATFLTSEKAAKLEAGMYFPIELGKWDWTEKDDNDQDVPTAHRLFIAPIFKGGIQTITGDRKSATAEARRFGGDDIYNFFSMGGMVGHYKRSVDDSHAPELINWLTVARGRFENFEYLDTDGPSDSNGNFLIRRRPWRYDVTGMLRIPRSHGFVIGFNGNFGKGPDDLRFLFGLRFDIAKVLGKLEQKP